MSDLVNKSRQFDRFIDLLNQQRYQYEDPSRHDPRAEPNVRPASRQEDSDSDHCPVLHEVKEIL